VCRVQLSSSEPAEPRALSYDQSSGHMIIIKQEITEIFYSLEINEIDGTDINFIDLPHVR
jgi:hypothetical protein